MRGVDIEGTDPRHLCVDLLWNGGIGTYSKSVDETHLATRLTTPARPGDRGGGNPGVSLSDAHDRSAGGEPVHCGHVGGWFPGEDGLAVVHGTQHVGLAGNSFFVG
jgi:hypothetical protein